MKVLLTGFYGKYNSSNVLVNQIKDVDKLILTNSFSKLKQEIDNASIEEYDLVLMFGINKFLKNEIRLEKVAKLDKSLSTGLNTQLFQRICNKYIQTSINVTPTKYLCNSAYYHILQRNSKALFIHIPGLSKIDNMKLLIDMINDSISNIKVS